MSDREPRSGGPQGIPDLVGATNASQVNKGGGSPRRSREEMIGPSEVAEEVTGEMEKGNGEATTTGGVEQGGGQSGSAARDSSGTENEREADAWEDEIHVPPVIYKSVLHDPIMRRNKADEFDEPGIVKKGTLRLYAGEAKRWDKFWSDEANTCVIQKYSDCKTIDVPRTRPGLDGKPGKQRTWATRIEINQTTLDLYMLARAASETKKSASLCSLRNSINALQYWYVAQRVYFGDEAGAKEKLRQGPVTKQILKRAELRKGNRAKELYEDRQTGCVRDGYDNEHLQTLIHWWLQIGVRLDPQNVKVWESLEDRAIQLMQHFAIGRGNDVRGIQLCDLFQMDLACTKYMSSGAQVFGWITMNGKTNKNGRKVHNGLLRHSNWLLDAVGAVGTWLHYEFDILKIPFPDTSERLAYYDCYLFPDDQDKSTTALSYRKHYKRIVLGFAAVFILSSAKTHAARGSGAREADQAGASDLEIARLGRWALGHMYLSYLTDLPYEVLLIQAGIDPDHERYLISRDVPLEGKFAPLKDHIFKEAKVQLAAIIERNNKATCGELPVECRDIAGQNFLTACCGLLKTAAIQDLAMIYNEFPEHAVVQSSPIFLNEPDLFMEYAARVKEMDEQGKKNRLVEENVNIPVEVRGELRHTRTVLDVMKDELVKLVDDTKRCKADASAAKILGQAIEEEVAQLRLSNKTLQQRVEGLECGLETLSKQLCAVQSTVNCEFHAMRREMLSMQSMLTTVIGLLPRNSAGANTVVHLAPETCSDIPSSSFHVPSGPVAGSDLPSPVVVPRQEYLDTLGLESTQNIESWTRPLTVPPSAEKASPPPPTAPIDAPLHRMPGAAGTAGASNTLNDPKPEPGPAMSAHFALPTLTREGFELPKQAKVKSFEAGNVVTFRNVMNEWFTGSLAGMPRPGDVPLRVVVAESKANATYRPFGIESTSEKHWGGLYQKEKRFSKLVKNVLELAKEIRQLLPVLSENAALDLSVTYWEEVRKALNGSMYTLVDGLSQTLRAKEGKKQGKARTAVLEAMPNIQEWLTKRT